MEIITFPKEKLSEQNKTQGVMKSHKFLMIIIIIAALIIRISIKSLLCYNNKADGVNNILTTVVIVKVPRVVWKQEGSKHVNLLTEGILFICMFVFSLFRPIQKALVTANCAKSFLHFVFYCHFTAHFTIVYLVLQYRDNNYP